jgi:hypothetical protein
MISWLPQPGGSGSRIYISQEQGGPVMPPGSLHVQPIGNHGECLLTGCCHGNVLTEPLPLNGFPLWLQYYGFQSSCHSNKCSSLVLRSKITFLFVLPIKKEPGSALGKVGIATGYGLDDGGVGVRVPVGSRIFSMSSRPVLGLIQPSIQWVPGLFPRG